ncbi:hypothetical protein GH714_002422 [Hevea brasiliensis]|uniref:Transposase-associated domain-containing protein n=1 Tax=Hevea brasiliensis TaxID=3981 RepID=A0A6A6LF93_HEVBR|nr:hypothetical protein GH714_002422 [Hevea brasiliensis]
MSVDRSWMYKRLDVNGFLNPEFEVGVEYFLNFAYAQVDVASNDKIRCPCSKCKNKKYLQRIDVTYHLYKFGFVGAYTQWDAHGEGFTSEFNSLPTSSTSIDDMTQPTDTNNYRSMVMEAMNFDEDMAGGRYMWDETEEQNVRLAWDKLGKDRFRDILNRARNEMLVKHKKSDIAYLHNLGPNWMKAEVWNELVAYWSSPEWRKKSQSAKINRMTVKDGSITKHACGSIKIEIHEDRLEDYASAIVEKYGSNSESPPIFDMDKWIEVSGGFNKGRVYGFGSSAKSQTSGSSTSQSCTSAYPGSSSQPAMTQEEIQQLIDEKSARMRAEMMAEILDQVRKELKTTGGTQFATSSHPTTSDSTNP